MTQLASVVVVCVTVLLLAWRAERLGARWLSLREQAVSRPATPEPVLPDDLRRLATRESQGWAVEEVRRGMIEAYHAASGTDQERWDVVRRRYQLALASSD
jgi:hypothetical protein